MLLAYIDELAKGDYYDLCSESEVDVYLVALKGFTEDKGLAEWDTIAEETVSRERLHYDDTSDGGNNLNGSWREFYAKGCDFQEHQLYSGSDIFFKNGTPNFRGVAKAAIYLRYSAGFIRWLSALDHDVAKTLENEIPSFEKLIKNQKTKKLEDKWDKFKAPVGKWSLPAVCTLSNGKHIVLGLCGELGDDWDDFEELNIDIKYSLELMAMLKSPE